MLTFRRTGVVLFVVILFCGGALGRSRASDQATDSPGGGGGGGGGGAASDPLLCSNHGQICGKLNYEIEIKGFPRKIPMHAPEEIQCCPDFECHIKPYFNKFTGGTGAGLCLKKDEKDKDNAKCVGHQTICGQWDSYGPGSFECCEGEKLKCSSHEKYDFLNLNAGTCQMEGDAGRCTRIGLPCGEVYGKVLDCCKGYKCSDVKKEKLGEHEVRAGFCIKDPDQVVTESPVTEVTASGMSFTANALMVILLGVFTLGGR